MRVKLTVEYDGTNYVGWQRQDNGVGVQTVLENALSELLGCKITCYGASRTDSGVHALGQVVHFDHPGVVPGDRFPLALIPHLPPDVACIASEQVNDSFNARFDSRGKRYEYGLLVSKVPRPLRRRYAWEVHKPLDVTAMRMAAKHMLGEHDFSCFQGQGCSAPHAIRELTAITIEEAGDTIKISVSGNAFVRYMVRILVGTLVSVGEGRMPPDFVAKVIQSRDRKQAGPTAPAKGLTLCEVYYKEV